MNRLAQLEARKLLSELDYLKSDLEYKSEIVSEADSRFLSSVNSFLEGHPELREAYEDVISRRLENAISRRKESDAAVQLEDLAQSQNSDPKAKKIYWDIAKATHPDKVDDERLNSLYIEAGKSYKSDDIIGLYKVCSMLGIDYEVDDSDLATLRSQIDEAKGKIALLESTATWAWNFAEDEGYRRDVVVRYVGAQLR